ncbi:MAG: hypothetical protein OWT28_01870 [Firmicutes bacterium]|nr:hypothetical protein [Bacillota bacterium]
MHEIKDGVVEGIAQETVCSEANLCIIVQNEVALNLALLDHDQARTEAVEQSAAEALLGVAASGVPFHTYSVIEATRGVMHGLVCAGLDVSYVTRLALRGMKRALVQVGEWNPETEAAIKQGLQAALVDLGMSALEDDQALDLPAFYVDQSAQLGHTYY